MKFIRGLGCTWGCRLAVLARDGDVLQSGGAGVGREPVTAELDCGQREWGDAAAWGPGTCGHRESQDAVGRDAWDALTVGVAGCGGPGRSE